MATLTSTASTNMAQFWPGTSGGTVIAAVIQTATQFRITVDLGGGQTYDILYQGTGFTYSGLTATGGTYTSISLRPTGLTTVNATLSGLSQPLADIYSVALATLVPLSGNDTIGGGFGNDTLLGGDGNDTITDNGGTDRDIRAGNGDDIVRLIGANPTGTVDGGAGVDQVQMGGNVTGLTVTGFEILNTNSSALTGRASLFESFDTIRVSAASLTGTVSLILSATGAATVLDLVDELSTGAGHRALFVTGSTDAETITSGSANDRLFGGGGNDVLTANDGDNWLLGGDGDDVLSTGDGNDILRGEAGNDTINAGGGNDTISDEGGGATQINAGAGNDGIRIEAPITSAVIDGGAGNDTILLLAANATADIDGGDGNDAITFGILDAASTVLGGAGDDTITAGGFSGQVDGGAGVDRFVGSADLTQTTLLGIEVLQGTFTLRAEQVPKFTNIIGGFVLAASGSPVVLDLTATSITSVIGSSDNETLTITGSLDTSGQLRAFLTGGEGHDVLTTLGGFDRLDGGDGNDVLNAGAGSDVLRGGAGRDRLEGGDGNDQLFGDAGADTLNGGLGDDRIEERGGGATTISGGDGVDDISLFDGFFTGRIDGGTNADALYLRYDDQSSFDSDNITGLQIVNVETLYVQGFVTARVAQLEGFVRILGLESFSPVSNMVSIKLAASGRATEVDLLGELGSQAMRLYGSRDDETIFSTGNNDIIDGGGGRNTISYAFFNSRVEVDLAIEDAPQNTGAGGIDTLSSIDNVIGTIFGDILRGSNGANVLAGGRGADSLTGGRGEDVFVFDSAIGNAIDRITDFNPGDDTIQIDKRVFAGLAEGVLAGPAFAANLSGNAGDASDRIIYETDTGNLYFDEDGTGAVGRIQFATLTANLALTNADFVVI